MEIQGVIPRVPHTPAILSPPPKGRVGQVAYVRVVIEGGDDEGHVWVVSAGSDRMESEPHSVRFHVQPNCLVTTLELRRAMALTYLTHQRPQDE